MKIEFFRNEVYYKKLFKFLVQRGSNEWFFHVNRYWEKLTNHILIPNTGKNVHMYTLSATKSFYLALFECHVKMFVWKCSE